VEDLRHSDGNVAGIRISLMIHLNIYIVYSRLSVNICGV
jgi:hypothetical protein